MTGTALVRVATLLSVCCLLEFAVVMAAEPEKVESAALRFLETFTAGLGVLLLLGGRRLKRKAEESK